MKAIAKILVPAFPAVLTTACHHGTKQPGEVHTPNILFIMSDDHACQALSAYGERLDEWELSDLEKDPMEMQNQYNNPEYAPVREQMHKELIRLMSQYGDSDSLARSLIPPDYP